MKCTITVIILLFASPSLYAQSRLVSWGEGNAGQLANGLLDLEISVGVPLDKTEPTPVTCYDDWKAVFSAKTYISFGIRQDGSLWMWGIGLGSGLALADREYDEGGGLAIQSVAGQVGRDKNWQSVSPAGPFTAAIKTDGTLWTWGRNEFGELGLGHKNDIITPQQVGTDTDWAQVVAAEGNVTALKTDGTIWTWGRGDGSLLGDGTTVDRLIPVQMGTDTDWKTLSTGPGFTGIAIKWDRSLWIWGNAPLLGLPVNTVVSTPTRVGTDRDWKAVSIGLGFALAQKMDGSLWSWGDNAYGQLGDGTFADHHTPQRIGTATDWVSMAAGGEFAIALKSDGSLWGWGGRATDIIHHGNVPQRIGTANNWKAVTAGAGYAFAIQNAAFNPMPTPLNLGPDINSCAAAADITANITGADIYKWYTPSTILKGTETLTASSPGTYKLVVNRSGCKLTDEVNVSLNNASNTLFQPIGTPLDNCPGYLDVSEPVTFTPTTSGGGTFSWSFGNGVTSTENAPQYTYPNPGHYEATLTSSCGGSTMRTVDVVHKLLPGDDVASCGEPVTLSTNLATADAYYWHTPDGTEINTASITASAGGTYTVMVRQHGCFQSDEVVVDFNKSTLQPDFSVITAGITLDDAAIVLRDVPLTFVGTGLESAKSYTWSLGDGTTDTRRSFEHAYTSNGDITVTLQAHDHNGCASTIERQFSIHDLIISDAISDNGDGKNDRLRFDVLPYTSDLTVTDQHGRTVFTASPYRDDFTGNSLPAGVYYYELRFREIGKSYKGFVHVMR